MYQIILKINNQPIPGAVFSDTDEGKQKAEQYKRWLELNITRDAISIECENFDLGDVGAARTYPT